MIKSLPRVYRVNIRDTVCCKFPYFNQRNYSQTSTTVDPYTERVDKARFDCIQQLSKVDPSSLLISKFYPKYLQDSFIALKSINIELSKISFGFQPGATDKSKEFNNLKFQFWLQQFEKVGQLNLHNASELMLDLNEPCTVLLADTVLRDLKIDLSLVNQMVHSHQYFYNNNSSNGFRNIDEICSFGEGTHSQINYLMQSVLLSDQLKGFSDIGINLLEQPNSNEFRDNLTDISAHLGQATAIGSFLIGLKYFAEKKQTLMLPTDSLTKHRLSEESCLRYLQSQPDELSDKELKEKVKNVVFEVATLANDHIITARKKLENSKEFVKQSGIKKFPDCIYLPYMTGIPTILYLERLEKHDFDIMNPKLNQKEWRLAYRAWSNYYFKSL